MYTFKDKMLQSDPTYNLRPQVPLHGVMDTIDGLKPDEGTELLFYSRAGPVYNWMSIVEAAATAGLAL